MAGVAVMAPTTMSSDEMLAELMVTEKYFLSEDVVSVTLASPDGAELPEWAPGSHIDLVLPGGITRQYSLCGSVDDRSVYRIGVLRDPMSRGGSSFVHDDLTVGSNYAVSAPRNHFDLVPAKRYLFLAGGIGVTPLIPMAVEAQRAGAEFTFVYCARSRAAMAFLPELEDKFNDQLVANADDECGLFDLTGQLSEPQDDTLVYACGPGPFLNATTSAASAWPQGSVHFERFEPIEFDASTNVPFEVELAHSGRVLDVPADRSVLSVLTEAGVRVLSSCTEGTCGTCEVGVLDGAVIHRDAVLSPEEQESGEMMMVCVSRCAGGRLTLDL